ncbi:MAG: hypothetical protein SFW36_11425 [Leptolyngbyaceae cyanobacterium bins.59]|nr:hypothetical protein [Leptolyngbyaceae cyanobacterium bins.59]
MTGQTQMPVGEFTRTDIEERLIRRALQETAFREALLQSPQAVWQQEFGNTDLRDLKLQVFAEEAQTLYLILSLHDGDLYQELEENPKAVWKREFGTTWLEGYTIRVLQEPSGSFYLVLPHQEPGDVWIDALIEVTEKSLLDPESTSALKRFRSLPRVTPKTKLGRILRRLQDWLVMVIKSNPLVIAVLRPFYWVRSLIYDWKRL